MDKQEPDAVDLVQQAAELTWAMLRFASGAAHPFPSTTPPGMPRVGEDVFIFNPHHRQIPKNEVPAFLAALPSPAIFWPSTTLGMISMHLLSDVTGRDAARMQHEFDNQRAGVEEMASQLGLTADSHILLEFDEEVHITTLEVMRVWSKRFGVGVGWSFGPLKDDARASARLHLFRSDGERTKDAPGPPRRR